LASGGSLASGGGGLAPRGGNLSLEDDGLTSRSGSGSCSRS
jgi:hypothetical protein